MMTGRIPGFRPRNYLRPSARRVVEFINTGSRESEMELDGLVRNAGAAKIVPVDGAKKSNNEPGKDHPSGFIQVTDDLAATSLAQTSPYWRTLIDNGSVAVVWNSDLKPDPKDNASLLLTYNKAGLFSKLGRYGCAGAIYGRST